MIKIPKILLKYKSEHRRYIKLVIIFTLSRFEVVRDFFFVPIFLVDRLYELIDLAKEYSIKDLKVKINPDPVKINYEVKY